MKNQKFACKKMTFSDYGPPRVSKKKWSLLLAKKQVTMTNSSFMHPLLMNSKVAHNRKKCVGHQNGQIQAC